MCMLCIVTRPVRISFLRVAAHSGPAGKTVTRVIAEILYMRRTMARCTIQMDEVNTNKLVVCIK